MDINKSIRPSIHKSIESLPLFNILEEQIQLEYRLKDKKDLASVHTHYFISSMKYVNDLLDKIEFQLQRENVDNIDETMNNIEKGLTLMECSINERDNLGFKTMRLDKKLIEYRLRYEKIKSYLERFN